MIALARASGNSKRQTRPLVRESAPHQETSNCLTVINIWSLAPNGCFIPRQTSRLTVGVHKTEREFEKLDTSPRSKQQGEIFKTDVVKKEFHV
jgi:hypothetical protein